MLGAAFKPDSDDVRDSPALDVAAALQRAGRRRRGPRPEGRSRTRGAATRSSPTPTSAVDAIAGADVVLLLTEWAEYRELDPEATGALVAHRRILDGRNVLDPLAWRAAGWTYRALGRP